MSLQKNLSKSMNKIRSTKNLTITEFSEELCISRSALQKILKGTANPRIDTIEYMAEKLQMSPAEILFDPKETPNINATFLLSQVISSVSELSVENRRKFLALFSEMISLFDAPENEE